MDIQKPKSNQQMPPSAQLVFKGKIFSVYQWEQEGYDGSKHIFERLVRPDTAAVIPVTAEGKIVISTQQQPGTERKVDLLGGELMRGSLL